MKMLHSAFTPLARSTCQEAPAQAVARRIVEEAVRDCSASEATLWLISEDGLNLEGTFNHGPTPQILEKQSVPISGSVIGMVISNGLAMSIGPDDYHNPTVDQLTGTRTLAMVASPVYCRQKVVGVLSAINPTGRLLFQPQDLERLSWKAYLLGLILNDAFVNNP